MAKKYTKSSKDDKLRSFLRRVNDTKMKIVEQDDTTETQIYKPTPEQLYSELEKSECTLFFYKMTDGTARRMRCTLNESAFTEKYQANDNIKNIILSNFANGKHGKAGLVPVWDLDSKSWKSFYVNRVYKLVRNEQTDAE
jgi:hypothetical protein